MTQQIKTPSNHITRRRLLAIAGGATAAATLGPAVIAATAQHNTEATPAATLAATPTAPTLPEFPIPSTLAADASPLFRTVTEALVTAMKATLVPGSAIGLISGDREEHATFGLASLSSMRPVTPETLFQIGSITKTVTATAIWHLIDKGVLDLNAPVRTYLPDLKLMDADVAEKVTVSNLLDHSAGWYGDDEGFDTGENDDSLARYVAERLPQLPQIFPLGSSFSYNNAAFTVLGRLIEVATGTTYNAPIQSLVLDPLGMDDSLLDHDAVRQRPYADGHAALLINGRVSVAVQTPLWIPRSVDPAGGIWSTTRDLLRYARFHMDHAAAAGPANIVSPESLAKMQEPAIKVPGLSMQMGKDWFVQDVDGIRAFYHGGDTLGQHADLVMIPEHDFALAVLTNGQGGGFPTAAAALNAALSEIPELATLAGKIGLISALTAPADAPPVDLTASEMEEYVGRFADPGQALTFAQTDAGLEVTLETIEQPGAWTATINPVPAPSMPVTFLAKDEAVMAGSRLPFIRDADGRVGWVSMGLRLLPRVEKGA
jgi:CubicO group peptidase (beta-lactamase class C family)